MTRPIRVLELRSVRGSGGGPEKTILYGARRADPARFAITVCYLRDLRDREFCIDVRAASAGVDYVEILERHSYDPSIWPKLRALVRERGIHIVHGHEYKTNLLTWWLAKREGVKPLSTVHGWFGRGTWREKLYYAGDKRVLVKFPRLLVVSRELADELVAAGSRRDAITVVPNGIDQELFKRHPERRDGVRAQLGLAPDDVVIGAVGRLERQKRFDLLMEAVAALRHTRPSLKLLIAGAGGLEADLKAVRQRLDLGDACVLLGHRADIIALHHAFDLFVQASDEEGSPNVVLEAMALETPIVATAVGGTTEILDPDVHGIVISAGNRQSLIEGMARALDDWPATKARVGAARRRVVDELSFDRRMERVEAIYEDLMMTHHAAETTRALVRLS
jgi:glycosyltransferase involved in cell wall biosynthesis